MPVLHAGNRVLAIVPQSLEDTFRIARYVFESGLAPKGARNAEAVTVILLKGLELGIKPMAALEGITVINGKASVGGNLALSLARASGLLENFVEECDGIAAICTVRRKGDSFDTVASFSVDDAKAAGLWNREGPWRSYPKRMLLMRARGFALRDAFGDILGGMILTEELEDPKSIITTVPVSRQEPIDPDAPPAEVPNDGNGAILDAQLERLRELMAEAKTPETTILKHFDLTDLTDMTQAEYTTAVNKLNAKKRQQAS